jgi:hypothetical protein
MKDPQHGFVPSVLLLLLLAAAVVRALTTRAKHTHVSSSLLLLKSAARFSLLLVLACCTNPQQLQSSPKLQPNLPSKNLKPMFRCGRVLLACCGRTRRVGSELVLLLWLHHHRPPLLPAVPVSIVKRRHRKPCLARPARVVTALRPRKIGWLANRRRLGRL